MKRFALCCLLALLASAVFADNVRVIDGDTLQIGETIYRLHGIDAPEYGQKCETNSSKTWPCGKKSTELLQSLTNGQNVTCDNRGSDGYGRIIGVCNVDETDLNSEMVAAGLAWAFVRYADDYVLVERTARAGYLGVWQAETQTPWDFRSSRWNTASQGAPEGCPIKGNISKNGRIYHAPWSPWYSRTKINLSKGERWFCNEAEAKAAGWRAPMWGG